MRLLRILLYVLIAAAAWLAITGIKRRDRRRLLASAVILLSISGLFPLALWLERGAPVTAPTVENPAAWQNDARDVIGRVRPSAFDTVLDCVNHVETLVTFYRRYPDLYREPLAAGELLLEQRNESRDQQPAELRQRYCVDDKPLHHYVTENYRALQDSTGADR